MQDVEVIVCSLPNLWCCLESTVPIQLETLVPMSSVDSSPAVHVQHIVYVCIAVVFNVNTFFSSN